MTKYSVFTETIAKFAAAVCLAAIPLAADADDYSRFYQRDLPIELTPVEAPSIPSYEVSITDFGGVGDGVTMNTDAFAKAMAHLAGKGGGRLTVPGGIWYTGPISFESNVELHLDRGALVLFSDNLADYPATPSNWEGVSTYRNVAPLSARGKHDIAITGFGTFNGNGQHWRPVKRDKTTAPQWKSLTASGCVNAKGNIWFPNERIMEIHEDKSLQQQIYAADSAGIEYFHDFLRPVLLSFIECKNVMLRDATFENSPAWNIHPLLCENVIIDNVNIRNPWYAQNGDGLDVESCNRVLVVNSRFDVGDDAICVKSGRDKEGRDRGIPCRDVLIEGCTVYHGHGGFVVGSEMSGGCRDIVARDCLFIGTDVGLRFKSTRGRGGIVENIHVDNIKMTDIAGDALIFDLYYGIKPGAPVPPVTEETPQFRDIRLSNINCRSARRAALFNGLPEMPVRNITVTDSRFSAAEGFRVVNTDGLALNTSRSQPRQNLSAQARG
ncbi:MAG: glycoside hydrolase family 28 protein [Muribaculaceae bacterium]|nr:glycoside hydrolase family 28 protein [Muribaculaceae bacterium]